MTCRLQLENIKNTNGNDPSVRKRNFESWMTSKRIQADVDSGNLRSCRMMRYGLWEIWTRHYTEPTEASDYNFEQSDYNFRTQFSHLHTLMIMIRNSTPINTKINCQTILLPELRHLQILQKAASLCHVHKPEFLGFLTSDRPCMASNFNRTRSLSNNEFPSSCFN